MTKITSSQSRLYAYILTLTGDREQAREILQETNLVIWRKAGDFELGTNFIAWAFKIARYQTMAYRQKIARDRLVFDEFTVDSLSDMVESDTTFDARQDALAKCIQHVTPNHRNMIRFRYSDGLSVKEIAGRLNRTANAIAKVLHRTRLALMKCIEHEVSEGKS